MTRQALSNQENEWNKGSIKQKLTILISASTSKLILCDSAWAFHSADVWYSLSKIKRKKKNADQTHRGETPPKCITFPYVK